MSNVRVSAEIGDVQIFQFHETPDSLPPIIDASIAASEPATQSREEICAACPSRVTFMGMPLCTKCGCLIALKTKIAKSSCPEGKWGAE